MTTREIRRVEEKGKGAIGKKGKEERRRKRKRGESIDEMR